MAKKITQKQVVQTDLWENTIKSTEELIKLVESLNKELSDTGKIAKKVLKEAGNQDFSNLKGVNEEIDKINKSFEQKVTIDKERIKLEKRLATARDEQSKDNAALKVQIQEQNKLNKEAAKEALGLNDAYQKQSKRLNELRKRYKSLILEEGKATKETKSLQKEIKKLDKELKEVDEAAGQFQRKIGDYPDSLGNAAKSILGVAAAAVTAKGAFDGVKGSLESSAEGSENVREVTSALAGVWDQVSNTVAAAALDVYDYGAAVVESVQNGEGLIDSLGKTEGQFERTSEATTDFTDKVKESIEGQVGLTERVIAFEKAIRPLEKRIVVLNGLIDEQQIIAGDGTRSFQEINDAILEGQNLQIERARLNISIAREELAISQERIRVAELANKSSVELLDQETEAVNKLKEAEIELANEILENEKEIRQVKQDRLERDLDILIDGFDNQKTINERIIANEKETLEERSRLLEETTRKANDSFREQKEVLGELSSAGIDVDELLSLDATELQKRIRELEQSEIIEGRTLEVVRERRLVLQDLEDAQNDLNDAQQEGLELQEDILAQEEALAQGTKESRETLEDERFENQKEGLERRIELSKEGSIEQLRLQKELNDLLLQEQDKQIAEEEKKQEGSLKRQAENREKVLTTLNELNDKFFNDRIGKIDEEIDANQRREDELKDLAAQGNADAAASLAQNQKDQAEANRKKEEFLQKQKQFELALAVISAFNAELDAGKDTGQALASAISSTTVLSSFVQSLPAFYDGTEDTGSGGGLDGSGGFHAVLHPNERVLTKEQNKKMGGISNDDAANVISDFNNDLLTYNTPQLNVDNTRWDSGEAVLKRFDKLEKSIVSAINDKETYLGGDWDTMRGYLDRYYKKGNTKTVVKSRLKG